MRFGLRTLFVGLALIAVVLAWMVAQRQWIHDRQEAREWAQGHPRVNIGSPRGGERLPIGLRLLGERPLGKLEIDIAYFDASDLLRVEQLPELFPEASVVVKNSGRRTETIAGTLRSEISELTRAAEAYLPAPKSMIEE
jgi:hypothetical protein